MQFRFEWLSEEDGKIRLKCFYGPGPDYAEFYIGFDFRTGEGEILPKDSFFAQVLISAFASTMTVE
jgi:hypothetical protein